MSPFVQGAGFHRCLRACLASLPDDVASAAGQLASIPPAEWRQFLDYATSHGVLAVLAPAVAKCDLAPPVREELDRRLLVQSMWSQQVVEALSKHLDLFADEGIPVCALKGPVFAQRVYAHASDRPSIDIDLLVSPDDLEKARTALLRAGYEADSDLKAAYLTAHAHHLHFTRAGVPELELHFQAYHGFGTVVQASSMMDRATPAVFAGRRTLVASPEDELIYLAAHAAGHSFIRLLWLFDMKMLIRAGGLDWSAVTKRSRELRIASAAAYAFRLLDRWLDVPGIPREALSPYGNRARVADRLLDVVAAPSTPSSMDNLGGLVFTAMLCDRIGATFGLAGHHLLRTARHRVHRLAPGLVPESWSA